MKTISVITTFFNSSKYIYKSIFSVLKQKTDNINIDYILVDDCSTDDSLEYVRKIIDLKDDAYSEYINVRILQTPNNLGCGGARKFGIDHALGEYLMFLDSDDYYIESDFVSRAANDIQLYNADIIEYGVIYHKPDGTTIPNRIDRPFEIYNEDSINSKALMLLFDKNVIKFNVWTKIIRKSLASEYPYSVERTFEDVDTIPIWVSKANKIVVMPSCEINYSINNKSIIREDPNKTRLGTLKSIARHFERFKSKRPVLMAMYKRAMMDFEVVLNGKCSDDPYFDMISSLNTYMLSYIFPNKYKEMTFNINKI